MQKPAHVTDYALLTAADTEALARAVVAAIHHGWQPWGAPLTTAPDGDGKPGLAQAVVRYAEWA